MTPRTIPVLALLCSAALTGASGPAYPTYSAAGLVNSADYVGGPLAPNTIATIYGTNLSDGTEALISKFIHDGRIPTQLPLSSVRVYVGGAGGAASIYYVSPTQINFLIPAEMHPQTTYFQITRGSLAGPAVPITLVPMTPAFYMLDSERVVAQHLDGSVIRTDHPAHPGEIVILYATGLGQTNPPSRNGEIPTRARPIAGSLEILLDGRAVDPKRLLYAGTAPGFAGLYQINLSLPVDVGVDPQIQMSGGGVTSPKNIRLVVRPAD
ncbi:MAG TPA: hypothetical protein VFA04_15095 [Bryobacteraceae bacterium]|nr:hypothetical protein [Bryobacteraceae bacterium]